jgi:hypothetical protein
MTPQVTWPTFVNCHSEEQFLREKALHDAQMHNPAYIAFGRYRYTALIAKMHNGWPISVAEYVEFQPSIPTGYSIPIPTPVTEEQLAAVAEAQEARRIANEHARWVREHTPVKETVGEVMKRLENSPHLRQKFIDENPEAVEQWVLGGAF